MEKNFKRKSRIDNLSKEEFENIVNSSYSWRELCLNLGYNTHNAGVQRTIKSRLNFYGISVEHFNSSPVAKTVVKDPLKEVLILNPNAADNTIRKYYKQGQYTEYKCSICGLLPFWNGKELTLTLDHINGNHRDSRIENLRWVCPNCDRQLDTFAGRNHRTN